MEEKKLYWDECQLKLELIEREVKDNTFQSISCPICLEIFNSQTETKSLPCGHKYCYGCISELTKPFLTKSCPICSQLTDDQEDDVSRLETKFRLESLQQKYPTFVTNSLIGSLTENPYHEKWISHHHWGSKYKSIFYHNEENSPDEESSSLSETEDNKSVQNVRPRITVQEIDDSMTLD